MRVLTVSDFPPGTRVKHSAKGKGEVVARLETAVAVRFDTERRTTPVPPDQLQLAKRAR